MMITLKEIGAAIRAARKVRGWSQTDLAKQVGLSLPAVSRVELGVDNAEWRTVVLLLGALEFDLELSIRSARPKGDRS